VGAATQTGGWCEAYDHNSLAPDAAVLACCIIRAVQSSLNKKRQKQHHAGCPKSASVFWGSCCCVAAATYVHACVTLQDVPLQELGCHVWAIFAQGAVPCGPSLLGLLANSHLLLTEQLQILQNEAAHIWILSERCRVVCGVIRRGSSVCVLATQILVCKAKDTSQLKRPSCCCHPAEASQSRSPTPTSRCCCKFLYWLSVLLLAASLRLLSSCRSSASVYLCDSSSRAPQHTDLLRGKPRVCASRLPNCKAPGR
jgi:hypothetical protein